MNEDHTPRNRSDAGAARAFAPPHPTAPVPPTTRSRPTVEAKLAVRRTLRSTAVERGGPDHPSDPRSTSSSSSSAIVSVSASVERERQLVLASTSGPVQLAPLERIRLEGRASALVLDAERAGSPITYLGFGTMPEQPRLYPGTKTDWLLMQIDDDPLVQAGRFPIPREQRRHLVRLTRSGIEMDELLVAHEVPEAVTRKAAPTLARIGPSDVPVELLPALVEHPGATESTKRFTARAGKLAEGAGKVAKGAAFAACAVAAAPIALAAMMPVDPVIFGVRRVPGQRSVVQIYELVRWEW